MGTSQSSTGPGPNVLLVPPWAEPVQEVEPSDQPDDGSDGPPDDQPDGAADAPDGPPEPITPSADPPTITAPERRFGATRAQLGSFAKTGDTTSMRRAVGSYVRTGYTGSVNMSRRMSGTSTTARSLSRTLDPTNADSSLDRVLLKGRSADEIMDAVVEAAEPQDGTLDTESSREAIRNSLSDLLNEHPDADLLALTDAQREFAIERFASHDVYRRFALDVGKHLVAKAPNPATGLARLKQVRNYIRQTIAASFRRLRASGRTMTTTNVRSIVAAALADSLVVFEGYM